MKFLNSRLKKIAAGIVIGILVIGLIGFITYSVASRLIPRKEAQTTDKPMIADNASAKKVIDKALISESKNNYDEATKQYEQSLAYYNAKNDKSVEDQNQIANIEARLIAIKEQLAQANKLPKAQSNTSAEQPSN